MVVGSAIGPSALALSRSLFGSYTPGLYAAAMVPALITLLALRPAHPTDFPPGRRSAAP